MIARGCKRPPPSACIEILTIREDVGVFLLVKNFLVPPPLSLLETMIRDWISASLFRKKPKAFLSVDFESVGGAGQLYPKHLDKQLKKPGDFSKSCKKILIPEGEAKGDYFSL